MSSGKLGGKPGVPSGLSIQKSFLGMPIHLGANIKLGNGSEMWDQIRDGHWSKLKPKFDFSFGIMQTFPTEDGKWQVSGGISVDNLGGKPNICFDMKLGFESKKGWRFNFGVKIGDNWRTEGAATLYAVKCFGVRNSS